MKMKENFEKKAKQDLVNFQCPLENECDVADNESLKCITPKECPLQSIKYV